jgi:hypothetical protein
VNRESNAGGVFLSVTKFAKPADTDNQDNLERLISQFVRDHPERRPDDENSGAGQTEPSRSPRRQVAAIQEIDRIIQALHALRGYLQSEGERVQLTIDEYEYTSVLSIQSAKEMAASLEWLKK